MSSAGDTTVTRRLAAILIADVAGYSRLMERDDTGTFSRLRSIRDEVVDPAIVSHDGRIVKTAGDGFLAEFPSALAALRASVQIQREMAKRNAHIPAEDRVDYRIGVNLGDIMIDRNDIAGDGVNVASRLQTLAEPGGICVSGAVREQVHGQLDVSFVDIGEQRVKNIERPIRVYRVALGTAAADGAKRGAGRLRAIRWPRVGAGVAALAIVVAAGVWVLQQAWQAVPPAAPPMSIAVMPFKAVGGADEQVADALTRDLNIGLARAGDNIVVVSYAATASYKGRPLDARAVGRELNVRYVTEGEIRRAGERTILSVQLIDTRDATQAWSGRFELDPGREEDRLLLTQRVRVALFSTPARGATARDLVARADTIFVAPYTLKAVIEAEKLLDEALRLEPNFVSALTSRAFYLFAELQLDLHADRDRLVQKMDELSSRAVSIDQNDASAWLARTIALGLQGRFEAALAANDRCRRLDPARKYCMVWRAWLLQLMGRPEESLALLREVHAVFPDEDSLEVRIGCMANLNLGRYDQAIALCEKSAGMETWYYNQVLLAAAYANKGDLEKAAAAKAELERELPGYSIAAWRTRRYSQEPAFVQQTEQHLISGLRKAGVPEQ